MCGIAAIVHPADRRHRTAEVKRMIDALRHRGDRVPVIRTLSHATIACARLAIVDAANGDQPMAADGFWIVMNGEIYNHAEMRAELESSGVAFASRCDTEVVLKAYRRWGADCLPRLEGMYAFVIVDGERGTVFAARDRFGIKPLYYAKRDGAWHFSSEIAPLLDLPPDTIRSFPPGSHLVDGRLTPTPYPEPIAPSASLDAAAAEFRNALSASVARHLPAGNERVALFCSGGIDSSAIAYEAVAACRRNGWDHRVKLACYSVGTGSAEDPRIAAALARDLDIPFFFEEIRPEDMVRMTGEAIAKIESFEPNHIRAGTASLALARRVHRDGYRVALVGEGADELLGGYEEFPDAVRRGAPGEAIALMRRFVDELHRTQLRRVDRTTMAFGVEARVPFLDDRLASFILSLPIDHKVHRRADGTVIGKHVLREAYRGRLPDAIVDRRKIPMGEGAGIGDNRPSSGLFQRQAEEAISEPAFVALAQDHPSFRLGSREDAYYFSMFVKRFGALALAATRPRTNIMATT